MKKSNEELSKLLKDFAKQMIQHIYPNQMLKEVTQILKANFEVKSAKELIKNNEPFYESFLFPFIKEIMIVNEYRDSEECREFIQISQNLISIFTIELFENINNNSYLKIFMEILNPENNFYKTFGNIDEQSIKECRYTLKINPNWVSSIKVSDRIDAVKKQNFIPSLIGWSSGIVNEITNGILKISWDNDFITQTIGYNSISICPYGAMTGTNEWRDSFKKDDLIDCMDTIDNWYLSTILETRISRMNEGKELKEVLVAFRTYSDAGIKSDEKGKYTGWSSTYDEWINSYNLRIQKPYLMSKIGTFHCRKAIDEEVCINDQDDILLNNIPEITFVFRPKKMQCQFFINNLNSLGKKYLTSLLDKIKDQNQEFEIIFNITQMVYRIVEFLHKREANWFVPKFQKRIIKFIKRMDGAQIRNVQKEQYEKILKYLDIIMRRVYTCYEKWMILEKFQLKIMEIWIKSDFLDKRIQAIKYMSEFCKNSKLNLLKYIDPRMLSSFILQYHFIEEIFGSRKHIQLIQRSSDILRLIVNEDRLSIENLDLIWNCTKDEYYKNEIIKLINEITLNMDPKAIIMIVDKLGKINSKEVSTDLLNLIHQFARFTDQKSEIRAKCSEILKGISFNSETALDVVETAVAKYADLISMQDYDQVKLNVIKECVNNIKENQKVIISIRMLLHILRHYDALYFQDFKPSIINQILNELRIPNLVLVNLMIYISNFSQNSSNEKYGMNYNINQRLSFITYIFGFSGYKFQLEFDQVKMLWDVLYVKAKTIGNKISLVEFLRDNLSEESAEKSILKLNDIERFFLELIGNPSRPLQDVITEELSCIQLIFSILNLNKGYISKSKIVNPEMPASAANVSSRSNYNYSFGRRASEDGFIICEPPYKLFGHELIWKIIINSNNKDVSVVSIDLLNKIYMLYLPENDEDTIKIRTYFIDYFIEMLHNTLNTKEELKQDILHKLMLLMKDFIDESEKKGTGDIKSHGALLKGNLINITVLNNTMINENSAPKKIDLHVYGNLNLWELKCLISKEFHCNPSQICLSYIQNELKDIENGKFLHNIFYLSKVAVSCTLKSLEEAQIANLLKADKTLSERAKKCFTEIFNKFSSNGKMNKEQCSEYINSCTYDYCQPDNSRVIGLFEMYDKDKDGFIELEGFLEFYETSCLTSESIVWINLKSNGFGINLLPISRTENKIEPRILPRYILSNNPKVFDLLFSVYDLGGIAGEQALTLILRLPTNPEMYNSILNLDTSKNINWPTLFNSNNIHKMEYTLQIIASFLEESEESKNSNFESKKKEWQKIFVSKGGLAALIDTLNNNYSSFENLKKFEVRTIIGSLEIIYHFINILFLIENPTLFAELKEERQKRKNLSFSLFDEDKNGYSVADEMLNSTPSEKENKTNQEKQTNDVKVPSMLNEKTIKEISKQQDEEEKKNGDPKDKSSIEETKEEKKKTQKIKLMNELLKSAFYENENNARVLSLDKFKNLLEQAIKVSTFIISKERIEFEEYRLVELCNKISSICILLNNELFIQMINIRIKEIKYEDILFNGLQSVLGIRIRESYFSFCMQICHSITKDKSLNERLLYILNFLIIKISLSNDLGEWCGEVFECLTNLIEISRNHFFSNSLISSEISQSQLIDMKSLLEKVWSLLINYQSIEKLHSIYQDRKLIGFIDLIRKILQVNPQYITYLQEEKQILNEIFINFLFPKSNFEESLTQGLPKLKLQKCLTTESRSSTFKLLLQLSEEEKILQNYIFPAIKSVKVIKGWDYNPRNHERSGLGFAGIENLGCICYMISMLQQFYNIETFRYGILEADDHKHPIFTKDPEIDDNVLHQLQNMYGFLDLTERKAYNPSKFCYSFKDMDGNPTNTSLQQDAHEFINILLGRLETLLKDTPQKYLAQSIFGGKFCSKLICKEGCKTVKRNYEDFYDITLGLKDSKNVFESFEKLMKGDTIADYFCSTCQKKVKLFKQTCISELPNILILHLQRIVFNYDTFMNEKVNSRLEFPEWINMEPYTEEGIELRENKTADPKAFEHGHSQFYYQYKLVGVVLHYGTADVGHYYSLINTVKGNRENCDDYLQTDKDKWLEFNDRNVSYYDFKQLKSDSFGGYEDPSKMVHFADAGTTYENMKSAYILIYERREKLPIRKVIQKEILKEGTIIHDLEENIAIQEMVNKKIYNPEENKDKVFYNKKSNEYFELLPFYSIKRTYPSNIFQEIFKDNNNFMVDGLFYSSEFFDFMEDLIKKISDIKEIPNLKENFLDLLMDVYIKFMFDILSKSFHTTAIKSISENLSKIIFHSSRASYKLIDYVLADQMQQFFSIMFKCSDRLVRVSISNILKTAILKCAEIEGEDILKYEEIKKEEKGSIQIRKYTSKIGTLLNICINAIGKECAQSWDKFEQFFELLNSLRNNIFIKYYNSKNMISVLIDFYLGNESPIYNSKVKRVEMGNRFRQPSFSPLIELVCFLSFHILPSPIQNYTGDKSIVMKISKIQEIQYICIEDELKCILDRTFIHSTISGGFCPNVFGDFIKYWSFENEVISKVVAKVLLKHLNISDYHEVDPFLNIMKSFLEIDDSFFYVRVEWILGIRYFNMSFSENSGENDKYGLSQINTPESPLYCIISTLYFSKFYDPLLALIYKSIIKYDLYVCYCLKALLKMMLQSQKILEYVLDMPSLNCNYKNYVTWIEIYTTELMDKNSKKSRFYKKEIETLGSEIIMLINECSKQSPLSKEKIIPAFLVGKTIDSKIIITEKKEDVTIIGKEITTVIYPSIPTTKGNNGIPLNFFEGNTQIKEAKSEKIEIKREETEVGKEMKVEIAPSINGIKEEAKASIFHIIIENKTQFPIKVLLKIIPKSNLNFKVPKSKLEGKVNPMRISSAIIFLKEDLEKPLGDFQINWIYYKRKLNSSQVAPVTPEESMQKQDPIIIHQFTRVHDHETDLNDVD